MGALFVCGFPLSGFFDPVFAVLSVVGPLCLRVGSIGIENIISGLVFELLCGVILFVCIIDILERYCFDWMRVTAAARKP